MRKMPPAKVQYLSHKIEVNYHEWHSIASSSHIIEGVMNVPTEEIKQAITKNDHKYVKIEVTISKVLKGEKLPAKLIFKYQF